MQRYEFQVVPAPRRGEKARGARTTEDRFALALTRLMNRMGAEGWDYVRADALPCDERSGLTGVKTTFQNMLVFRRPLGEAHAAAHAAAVAGPAADAGEGRAGWRATAGAVNGVPPPVAGTSAAGRSNGAAPPPSAAAPAREAAPGARAEDAGRALPRLRLEAPIGLAGSSPALGPARTGRD